MKKIIAFVCTIILVCALNVSVFAESESVVGIETNANAVTNVPTAEETATAGEISGDRAMPEITTELIVGWVKGHFEEIAVIISLIVSAGFNIIKHKRLNRSISSTNKNAITVSENSEQTIQHALERMDEISADVSNYKEEFATLLEEYRTNADEKQKLEQTLNEAMTYIHAAKLANIELADVLAEILLYANIPGSRKDVFYSRHIAAVNTIAEAEKTIAEAKKTEVNTDADGKET